MRLNTFQIQIKFYDNIDFNIVKKVKNFNKIKCTFLRKTNARIKEDEFIFSSMVHVKLNRELRCFQKSKEISSVWKIKR